MYVTVPVLYIVYLLCVLSISLLNQVINDQGYKSEWINNCYTLFNVNNSTELEFELFTHLIFGSRDCSISLKYESTHNSLVGGLHDLCIFSVPNKDQ